MHVYFKLQVSVTLIFIKYHVVGQFLLRLVPIFNAQTYFLLTKQAVTSSFGLPILRQIRIISIITNIFIFIQIPQSEAGTNMTRGNFVRKITSSLLYPNTVRFQIYSTRRALPSTNPRLRVFTFYEKVPLNLYTYILIYQKMFSVYRYFFVCVINIACVPFKT